MAVAFGTIASATRTFTSPDPDELTITKPTSLATGDLMVAVVGINGTALGSWTPPSGFTAITDFAKSAATYNVAGYWKIADAGDVAASNFAFEMSTADSATSNMAGFIMRVTSTNGFTGAGNIVSSTDANSTATDHTFTPGITPLSDDSLYLLGSFARDNITQSAYAITNNNPTWTERADISIAATNDAGLAVATANATVQAATGDFTLSLSGTAVAVGFLIGIEETTSITPTISVITATFSVQAPVVAGASNVTVSAALGATFSVQAPTVSFPTPTYANLDKSSTSTFTNPDKS